MENGVLLRKTLSYHWDDLSPLEVKIFLTLYWLADPDSGELSLSLNKLSDKLHVPVDALLSELGKLLLRGLILFNSHQDSGSQSHFKILVENKTHDIHDQGGFLAGVSKKVKETATHVNDNVNNINNKISFNINDNDNVTGAAKKSRNHPQSERAELTARQIARALDDEKNLALYEAYLNRYPADVIFKAYDQVLKTPRQRIKKSPGAYFTFLVKKFGSVKA